MWNRWSALMPGILAALVVMGLSLAGGRLEELGLGRAIIEPLVLAILIGMVVRTLRGDRAHRGARCGRRARTASAHDSAALHGISVRRARRTHGIRGTTGAGRRLRGEPVERAGGDGRKARAGVDAWTGGRRVLGVRESR